MAGLTAAFELTKTPELRAAYEVTVYQMGWRLGGKCATGRGPNGRIQEHGIHGFSGSYYNTFGLMHACYAELPAATCVGGVQSVGVLKSFNDAFRGVDKVNLWEVRDRRLISWPFYIAPNKMDPGDYDTSIAQIAELVQRLRVLFSVDFSTIPGANPADSRARLGFRAWLGEVLGLLRVMYRSGLLLSIVRTSCSWLNIFQGLGSIFLQAQRLALTTDFLLALRRGWKADQVCSRGFDSIDDLDYRAWLARHKASQRTLDCSVSYNTIDLAYSYPGGDTTRAPEMGAGTYLHWTLRMLLNMGSLLWTFAAGTGETLIAPLYHVLKFRGVSFKFFHKVTALRLTSDGARIAAIEFDEQARLKTPSVEYDPLVRCGELLCWPAQPKYELIADGDILQTFDGGQPVDLESYWSPWNDAAADRKKKLVAGEDFDKVVFAISIEAVQYLCRAILDADSDGRWRTMLQAVRTCPTQTMQIWLKEAPGPLVGPIVKSTQRTEASQGLNGTFVQPFNGQVDFSSLLNYEDWDPERCGGSAPESLWYFSGAMSDELPTPDFTDHAFPARQHQRVKHQAIQFLQATTGYLWHKTHATWSPMALDFQNLWSPDPTEKGLARFEHQFWRANIDPSERYVLALAGSTGRRLKADGGGIGNLALAGDWIYNGLNLGSVEGAVMGGMLAADAVQEKPTIGLQVIGYPHEPQAGSPAGPPAQAAESRPA